MRALGQVIPGSRYHLLDHDAWLNDQAIARLEALSALPRHRLATALPALRWGPPRWFPPLPEDSPALRCYRPCLPPGPPAGHARFRRHRRHGPDPAAGIPAALPPTPAMARRRRRNRADRYLRRPEILTAHRRCQQLLARSGDRDWAAASIGAAWNTLLPGTLPKRPDRHLGRRAPQQVRPDPRQLLEQVRALPGPLHPVPRKKPVQVRRPHSQPSHENWPTRRSEHAQWPDPTRPDSADGTDRLDLRKRGM